MSDRAQPAAPLVRVEHLAKTFSIGFFRKKVEAVRDVSFEVRPGEVFGLLGPNGAGKTTTIKMLLGLIFPTRGALSLFGASRPTPEALARLGYLPENPYVYQYLKPLEFLDLAGRLSGLGARERRERSLAILARVGLTHAVDRPIGRFSKGMTQRIGLAQALLHDPELLILDEPMSGLDPIGRKEVRDLILEERARGKTILFTSHILSDVEQLCDRVVILDRGRVRAEGALVELLRPEERRVVMLLASASEALARALEERGAEVRREPTRAGVEHLRVSVPADGRERALVRLALDDGAELVELHEARETLEALFVREATEPASAPASVARGEGAGASRGSA